ncbi:putative 3-ketoacyl-CoA synthase 21 [Lathyrus oleraceus]|uniref:very-long-chain 3-oxoacyl-CoA synthase n=2 Tax=Pisum sativum TaxID=3888 RepID=A0A9D5BMI1_PEA|nr:putative 3-ketoacyl-CoA synthase 21 [Pisum sativum]
MGGSAVLMSSRVQDKRKAKYELQHIVRTINAYDDQSYACVYQDMDSENKEGVSISKNIVNVCGDVLKKNIGSLGPLVLPWREQFLYVISILCYKIWSKRTSIYTPNFNRAFEHFCIHSGGRAVIQAIERNLKLKKQDVEPSKMSLYRFGNTSSASIWYELSYIEAKGRMKCGDRVWQIAFGSGFKCNSAVWKCLCDVKPDNTTAWRDTIHSYPVDIL